MRTLRNIFICVTYFAPLHAEYIPGPIAEIPWAPGKFFNFTGNVKHAAFWDSRQNVTLRDGDDLAFPKNRDRDKEHRDINAIGDFNFVALESFLSLQTKPIQIGHECGPWISGEFDANFSGANDRVINSPRLYGAFMDVIWKDENSKPNMAFKLGHTFGPSFVLDAFPRTVAFSAGSPFEPFLLVPQLRAEFFLRDTSIMFCAMAEANEFSSVGCSPLGEPKVSDIYLRNSKIPIIYAQVRQKIHDHFMIWAVQERTIKPRLESDLCFKVHELVTGVMAFWLFQINAKPVTTTLKLIYGQNVSAEGMLGAYGIKHINPLTDERSYTPVQSINGWLDIHRMDPIPTEVRIDNKVSSDLKDQSVPLDTSNFGKGVWWDPGLFFGFAKNLGSIDPLVHASSFPEFGFHSYKDVVYGGYACKADIFLDWLIRVAPRVIIRFKNFWLGIETEYMRAMYGHVGPKAKVYDTHPVDNFRFLAAWYYFF